MGPGHPAGTHPEIGSHRCHFGVIWDMTCSIGFCFRSSKCSFRGPWKLQEDLWSLAAAQASLQHSARLWENLHPHQQHLQSQGLERNGKSFMGNHDRPRSATLTETNKLSACSTRGKAVGENGRNVSKACCLTKSSFGADGPAPCYQHEPRSQRQCMNRHKQYTDLFSGSIQPLPAVSRIQTRATAVRAAHGSPQEELSLGTELLFPALTSHPPVSPAFSLFRERGLCACNEISSYKGQDFSLGSAGGNVLAC